MAQIPERAPNVEGQLEADPDVSLMHRCICPLQQVADR